MKAILAIILSLVTLSFADSFCPNIGSAPVTNTLTFCTDYSDQPACCDTTVDGQLKANFGKASLLLGTQNCYANMKTMFCAAYCQTNQADYMQIDLLPNNIRNITIFVNDTYVRGFYQSCKDRCLIFGGGSQTVGDTYTAQCGEANAPICFLAFLASSNDPTFVPSPTYPYAQYADGLYSVTNLTLSLPTALNGTGADLTGCTTNPTTSTTTGSGSTTVYSAILLLFLVFVFLF
eukprot:TRINITY_DN7437_c1_g1_i1.p1 TRINITY_DN7437_c1_g1~~TRINITY_DN7437_c1_g1_i1.p1  ORF type:complete len:234 (-),score=39.00 TRINITY_DN7437_c1_g1_i1:96-797(-)